MIKFRSLVGYALAYGCSNYWLRKSKNSFTGVVLVVAFDNFKGCNKFSKKALKNYKKITVRNKGGKFLVSVPVDIDTEKFKKSLEF